MNQEGEREHVKAVLSGCQSWMFQLPEKQAKEKETTKQNGNRPKRAMEAPYFQVQATSQHTQESHGGSLCRGPSNITTDPRETRRLLMSRSKQHYNRPKRAMEASYVQGQATSQQTQESHGGFLCRGPSNITTDPREPWGLLMSRSKQQYNRPKRAMEAPYVQGQATSQQTQESHGGSLCLGPSNITTDPREPWGLLMSKAKQHHNRPKRAMGASYVQGQATSKQTQESHGAFLCPGPSNITTDPREPWGLLMSRAKQHYNRPKRAMEAPYVQGQAILQHTQESHVGSLCPGPSNITTDPREPWELLMSRAKQLYNRPKRAMGASYVQGQATSQQTQESHGGSLCLGPSNITTDPREPWRLLMSRVKQYYNRPKRALMSRAKQHHNRPKRAMGAPYVQGQAILQHTQESHGGSLCPGPSNITTDQREPWRLLMSRAKQHYNTPKRAMGASYVQGQATLQHTQESPYVQGQATLQQTQESPYVQGQATLQQTQESHGGSLCPGPSNITTHPREPLCPGPSNITTDPREPWRLLMSRAKQHYNTPKRALMSRAKQHYNRPKRAMEAPYVQGQAILQHIQESHGGSLCLGPQQSQESRGSSLLMSGQAT